MQENRDTSPRSSQFEFQKWPVYREAVRLTEECHRLCGRLPTQGTRSIIDQLRRASQSVPLNIAEGSARFTKADKVNFLRVARGSVFECAAILDVLKHLFDNLGEVLPPTEERLVQIGKMLSGFIRYLENEKPQKRQTPLGEP